MPIFLSIVYTIIMFIIGLFFIIQWYRKRDDLYLLADFGFTVGGIFVLGNIVIVFASFSEVSSTVPSIGGLLCGMVIGQIIGFFRMGAFAVMGIYFATLVQMPTFPLLTGRWGFPHRVTYEQILSMAQKSEEEKEADEEHVEPSHDGLDDFSEHAELADPSLQLIEENNDTLVISISQSEAGSNTVEPEVDDSQSVIDMRFYIMSTGLVTISGIIYSIILFTLTKPRMSEYVQELGFGLNNSQTYEVTFATLVTVILFALSEEVVFRLGIQNFLAYRFKWQGEQYWIAIVLTALLWTLGHAGTLSPDWVKLLQIFPVGIALGWLYKKNGTESVMIAHVLFNVVLVFLGQNLIQL